MPPFQSPKPLSLEAENLDPKLDPYFEFEADLAALLGCRIEELDELVTARDELIYQLLYAKRGGTFDNPSPLHLSLG